jgi:hypothetical protein
MHKGQQYCNISGHVITRRTSSRYNPFLQPLYRNPFSISTTVCSAVSLQAAGGRASCTRKLK